MAEEAEFNEDAGEEIEEEGVEIQEHLKDAVEGSLRLKRLLTQDDDENPAKKQKMDSPHMQKVSQLLTKWRIPTDAICHHVLAQLPPEELDGVIASNYVVDINNQWKSAGELLAKFVAELRERKMPSGGILDVVASFRTKWKLGLEADKLLRTLSHKDLRYVLNEYDGTTPLDDVISEAAGATPEDDDTAAGALPEAPGVQTIGRFSRLELIDPLADCAVFGDANLTFSLKLAKHRKALGHVGRVIATTFEELETLKERYKEIEDSIRTLEEHYAEVYHGIDCTRIAIDSRFEGLEGSLGAVYYNFPLSGAIQGFFDGHPIVNWRHENLMRLFFPCVALICEAWRCCEGCFKYGRCGCAVLVHCWWCTGERVRSYRDDALFGVALAQIRSLLRRSTRRIQKARRYEQPELQRPESRG